MAAVSARPAIATALFVLLLASSMAAGGQPLDGFREEEASTGKVYWRGWSDEDRREVLDLLPMTLSRIESRLGRRFEGSFTTILVPDGFELRRVAERLLGE